MPLILKILLIAGAIVALLILFIVGSTLYYFATKQIRQEIARNVLISAAWLDIWPHPPLKARLDVQNVFLVIEGYKYELGAPLVPLTLKDGTELHPELQVIDEYGKVYHLSGLTLIGSLVGFGAKFPRDRTYTGVKIRSDQAFRCSKVYWDCSRLK